MRKKYIKIERLESKGLLGIGKNIDYQFTRLAKTDNQLPKHQTYLLDSLFSNSNQVLLSDLKGTFYNEMNTVKSLINKSLSDKQIFNRIKSVNRSLNLSEIKTGGLFSANPQAVRLQYIIFIIIVGLCFLFFVILPFAGLFISPLPVIVSISSMILAIILAYHMPQRTAIGTNYMLQAKGLRQTIQQGAWREKIMEKHLFIEEVLPFAISLGVVKQLARDMEELNIEPPSYFTGLGFHSQMMSSFISDFSHQTIANLTYNPSSSKWSGGSGFSGGSSGGGGGGGGGGSW